MSSTNILSQLYRFDFVTDPDDPNIPYDELINFIENNNINIIEENIDRGLVKYTVSVGITEDTNPDFLDNISRLVGEVSYVPVTVSMDTKRFENSENIGSIITGAEEIISSLTEKIMKTTIINV